MKTDPTTISGNEKLSLISNLATMLTAGLPILEVIDSLRDDAKGGQKKILDALRNDLIQGNRISVTFARFPKVFDKVMVNVINAAEEAGTLAVTLEDLKVGIQKDMEFGDKVKSALVYPVFIAVVFVAILLVILLVVIPRIAEVFGRLRVPLPLPTRILIVLSNLLIKQTIWVVVGLVVVGVGGWLLAKRHRSFLRDLLFSLPFVSGLVKEIDLTRFSRSLSLLLIAGIPITSALELSVDIVIRRDMAKNIARARELVLSGKKLSEGFWTRKQYFPTIMIKLIEAGEKTGTLDKSMENIATYYDYQVTKTLKTVTALIEPIMLVVIGVVVGGIMMAVISPIYGLIGQVGGR